MDYTLAVLTHGRSRTLDATLRSFTDKVKPAPSRVLMHSDAGLPEPALLMRPTEMHVDTKQRGFCEATRRLWKWASAHPATEFTFWLEHDFIFLRPVDLVDLAGVLDGDKSVAQMALMRGPVSIEEVNAGGLYEMRADDYLPEHVGRYHIEASVDSALDGWLRHRAYFTTNPSLMRTAFMEKNQWPDDDQPECEGRFGLDLVQRGFSFGVWGSGPPWVDHTGRRDGTGRGY